MKTFARKLSVLNDAIAKVVMTMGIVIIAFSVLALTGGAVTRYVTGLGFDWIMDLPPVLMPWLVFMLAGVLLRSKAHITVDFMPRYLSDTGKTFLSLFVHGVVLVLAIVFLIAGIDAVILFRELGQVIELEFDLPYWYVYLSFPVGFGILALFAIELLLTDLMALSPREKMKKVVSSE